MTLLGWQTTVRTCSQQAKAKAKSKKDQRLHVKNQRKCSLLSGLNKALECAYTGRHRHRFHICSKKISGTFTWWSTIFLLFAFVRFDLTLRCIYTEWSWTRKRRRLHICNFELQCADRSWYCNWSVGSRGAQDNIRGNGLDVTAVTFSWPWSGHCGGRPWPSAETLRLSYILMSMVST